ncbi:MAG: DUF2202 domain-containing protein [Bacteroidota bacterium]|nr:DUF2202 domain-containing protein [Bacteroidota bacterium]
MTKRKLVFNMIAIVSLALVIASCTKEEAAPLITDDNLEIVQDFNLSDDGNLKSTTVNFVPTANLTQDEIDGLLWMREEEKVAMDVYNVFYDTYGLKIFDNIAKSELKHTNAVKALLDFYSIPDPALSSPGLFTNQDLQQLYDDLILQGMVSEVAALQTGALIEEVDILDIEEEMVLTTNPNILMVYNNLLNGSKRHLVAFVKVLDQNGVVYVPLLLDPLVYADILTNTTVGGNGNGNGGNGNNGNCNGSGNGSNGNNGSGNNGNGGNGNNGGNGSGNGGNGNGSGNGNGNGSGNGNGGNGNCGN